MAAMALQTEGLIKYNRGHINIIDRQGLEAFTCKCYQAVRDLESEQDATTRSSQDRLNSFSRQDQ